MNAPLPAVHEAETQRQHARLRVPVEIVLDENRQTHDWSVGGFSVETAAPFTDADRPVDLTLQFRFRGFSMSLPLKAELRHSTPLDAGGYRSGFRFVDLQPDQTAALQYIVGANMSGELVHTADVFAVINRDNASAPRRKTPPTPPRRTVAGSLKRTASILLVLAAAAGVLLFILATIFERAYLTDAVSGAVAADTVTARAPANGALAFFAAGEGGATETGAALIGVERTDGRVVYLDSPCACAVLDVFVREREYVEAGDPVATLAPVDAKAFVRAFFAPADVRDLSGQERALVRRIGDHETISGRIVDRRMDARTGLVAMTIDVGDAFALGEVDTPVAVTLNSAPFSF